MNEATARMLRLAQRDLRAVQGMLDDPDSFPDEIFGFHAQQAVEKAAKSWLDGLGIEYPKTHDLDLLFELLAESGGEIPPACEELRDLVDFSVQYRYEAFEELPLDRQGTLRVVTMFIEHVAARVAS
jgi:hypothetical protein